MEKALERKEYWIMFSHRDKEANKEKCNGKKLLLLTERTETNHFKSSFPLDLRTFSEAWFIYSM